MKERMADEVRQQRQEQRSVSRCGLPDNDIIADQNILDGSLGKYPCDYTLL